MRRLVLDEQGERAAVLVPARGESLKCLDSLFGDDVGRVALDASPTLRRDHRWVVVRPLADEHAPFIEAHWIALEMPLSEDAGAIARFAEESRPGRLGTVERLRIGWDTMASREAAGEKGRPAWCADRILDEEAVESHAFFGQAINRRRRVHPGAVRSPVRADRLPGVVVAHDEQNVGPGVLFDDRDGGFAGVGQEDRENRGKVDHWRVPEGRSSL